MSIGTVIIQARSKRVRDEVRDPAYGRTAVVSKPGLGAGTVLGTFAGSTVRSTGFGSPDHCAGAPDRLVVE
ncbi:hypothetical protein NIE79_000873 [Micromonospora sp. NIE79]|uniref:Uncharacterized protein n=1 Tax=Micromonospora trifolii TaxID=2911208 RepID=A0ABS9MZH5_9ACTN|nr:hypothetical protein [Micromonospora trifolii]MCG5443082.1 hypothetical protein [Micromonospora trifolii]